mmetsp:Transcript_17599/g.42333  ORF Transcript_17599/g.42333 Transcript_17599/m.42333 type:complete len:361 (+) Transcript_17599:2699-3781(+)
MQSRAAMGILLFLLLRPPPSLAVGTTGARHGLVVILIHDGGIETVAFHRILDRARGQAELEHAKVLCIGGIVLQRRSSIVNIIIFATFHFFWSGRGTVVIAVHDARVEAVPGHGVLDRGEGHAELEHFEILCVLGIVPQRGPTIAGARIIAIGCLPRPLRRAIGEHGRQPRVLALAALGLLPPLLPLFGKCGRRRGGGSCVGLPFGEHGHHRAPRIGGPLLLILLISGSRPLCRCTLFEHGRQRMCRRRTARPFSPSFHRIRPRPFLRRLFYGGRGGSTSSSPLVQHGHEGGARIVALLLLRRFRHVVRRIDLVDLGGGGGIVPSGCTTPSATREHGHESPPRILLRDRRPRHDRRRWRL